MSYARMMPSQRTTWSAAVTAPGETAAVPRQLEAVPWLLSTQDSGMTRHVGRKGEYTGGKTGSLEERGQGEGKRWGGQEREELRCFAASLPSPVVLTSSSPSPLNAFATLVHNSFTCKEYVSGASHKDGDAVGSLAAFPISWN